MALKDAEFPLPSQICQVMVSVHHQKVFDFFQGRMLILSISFPVFSPLSQVKHKIFQLIQYVFTNCMHV